MITLLGNMMTDQVLYQSNQINICQRCSKQRNRVPKNIYRENLE